MAKDITQKELEELVRSFDFATLSYYSGENLVFYDPDKECFKPWPQSTDKKAVENYTDQIFIGYLQEWRAKQGKKPTT